MLSRLPSLENDSTGRNLLVNGQDGKFAVADDVLPDGTKVRRGNIVAFYPYAMGRMEYLWGPDALEFKPDRWLRDGVFQPASLFKFTAFQVSRSAARNLRRKAISTCIYSPLSLNEIF